MKKIVLSKSYNFYKTQNSQYWLLVLLWIDIGLLGVSKTGNPVKETVVACWTTIDLLQILKWMKTVWDLGILKQEFFCLCIPRRLDQLPPTSSTILTWEKMEEKNVTQDLWQGTHGTWHVTHYTWRVPSDTWWGVNILSKYELPFSYGLGKTVFWRLGGKVWLAQFINATPGLLNT